MKKPKLKKIRKPPSAPSFEPLLPPTVREEFLEVVDNQLRELNPPETKECYERLVSQGFSDQQAREYIGVVIFHETLDVLREKQPFNVSRYTEALARLPKLP